MKKLIFLLLLFNFNEVKSQDSLEVKEATKSMSLGERNAFTTIIPQVKYKNTISEFKKYIKQKNKIDVDEVNGEYKMSGVVTQLSADTITFFVKFKDRDSSVEMDVFILNKDSTFLSSSTNAEVAEKAKTLIRNFIVNAYRNAVGEVLKTEQKKLELLEEGLVDLEKQNEKSNKTISANERSIERFESDIKLNKRETESKSEEVLQQKKVVGTYLDKSDLKSAEEKKLKNLEKEKKKLISENESMHDDIDDLEKKNKELKKSIDTNETENFPKQKSEIEKQKGVVSGVDAKMKNIK